MASIDRKRFLLLRRQIIAGRFQNLNPMQRRAVLKTEGPLLLLAGAGSGKTTVLIHRVANLLTFGCAYESDEIPPYITEDDVDFLENYITTHTPEDRARAESLCALRPAEPWSVIAITFTNKAANQLKERLENMLGASARDVWAMTFHSACCRILRRDIDRLGYDKRFVIYDAADSANVIKQALAELNLDDKTFPLRSVLNVISKAKDKMRSPEEFRDDAVQTGDIRLLKIADIYAVYQQKLTRSNALDFDDIIFLTVKLLQENEDIRTFYQRKFRYVLIDEYQDTNHMQYLLASLLAGGYGNICVVGDDDQSIYKFRGASIENILSFEEQYPGTELIRLEQNYRSTVSILNAANAVIANNVGRKGKTLWTENGEGEKIRVYEALTEEDEAIFAANRVLRAASAGTFRDCAILYRTNAQSAALERAFQRGGIPYRIIGGHRFFDRAEVKDVLAYLYLINEHSDDFHLLRIVNNPPRGIGEKTMEVVQRQANAAQIPLYDVLRESRDYPSLDRAAVKLKQFADLIEDCEKLLETMTLVEFYDEMLRRIGYLDMLQAKNDVESMTRAENVRELRSSIVSYMESADEATLAGFLEEVSLFTDIEQYDADADAAVMMTIHSAKGLEFPHVCIVGMEEGLFPGAASMTDPSELEEERRLCYVAITRAKKTLSMSFADRRMLYGRTTYNRPSRFLYELPEDCTDGKPERRAKTREFFDDDFTQPTYTPRPTPSYPQKRPQIAAKPKPKPTVSLKLSKGDTVLHKAFGKGLVLTVLPMGGDALLEIAFDNVGTKRLMLNTAAQFMTKQ
ncbi:MAG: UvrD-helicase domain-containing protein [Oscillospiraceae bacterium]|nr:UvrD-helicase domain-containing protein [Oscillospiraceae bacterium]